MLASSVLDPLYTAIGWLLAVFYWLPPHNLGVAIILLTVTVMLVQFPLTAKQARSMILMQRVQPEIKKIQQKYKDDRQKQNEELLKFYQENNINPLAGCLPLLIQFPIGIALFRALERGVQHHIPTSGAFRRLYTDMCTFQGKVLSAQECSKNLKPARWPNALGFLSMNLNLSATDAYGKLAGGFVHSVPYFVLVVLVVATGWYQVRQTQARQLQSGGQVNQQMQTVTRIMPLFFGLVTLRLNAGATLYFVVSNLWRVGQQHFVLNRIYEEAMHDGGAVKAPPPGPSPAKPSKGPPPGLKGRSGAPGAGTDRTSPARGGRPGSDDAAARLAAAARRKRRRKR